MTQDINEIYTTILSSNELNNLQDRGCFIDCDDCAMEKDLSSIDAMELAFKSLCRNDLINI